MLQVAVGLLSLSNVSYFHTADILSTGLCGTFQLISLPAYQPLAEDSGGHVSSLIFFNPMNHTVQCSYYIFISKGYFFSLELSFPLYDLFSVHRFYSLDSSSRYFTWVSQLSHIVENKNLFTHPLFKKTPKHLFTQHLNKQAREQRPGKITLGCVVSMNV